MKNYELALVLKSSLSEADQKKFIDETKKTIGESGQVLAEKALGRKNLAYRIGGETNGVFFVVNFQAEAPVPVELARKLRLDEDVLRYIIEQREAQTVN